MFNKRGVCVFVAAVMLLMGQSVGFAQQTAKYIFIFIGDGMGGCPAQGRRALPGEHKRRFRRDEAPDEYLPGAGNQHNS